MKITEFLTQMGGMQAMARELNVDEGAAASGAEALIPAILGGFKKQVQAEPSGLSGLLGQLGGGELLDDVVSPQPTHVERGNAVLGQIFGSKDVSRAVAQNAAQQSGLAPDVLKKMLPMLAMLVAGYMSKQGAGQAAAGGLGGLVGHFLGGRGGAAAASGGGAGLAGMLDLDGDGNALDDILRLAGKAMRK